MLKRLFILLFVGSYLYSCDFPEEVSITTKDGVDNAQLDDFSPKNIVEGGEVIFTGTVFYANMPSIAITFNGVPAVNPMAFSGYATAKVPIGATTGKIVVKAGGKEYIPNDRIVIWNRMAVVPGGSRYSEASFTLNNVPYVGLGSVGKDFWQYNISNNTWVAKANVSSLTGSPEEYTGFAINGKGYFLGGNDVAQALWEYNPSNNTWTKKNGFSNTERYGMLSVVANGLVYAGMGRDGWSSGYIPYEDFWEYNPTNNVWTKKANIPSGYGRKDGDAVVLGTKIYVVGGLSGGSVVYDVWEYNITTNTWTRKANTTEYFEAVMVLNGKIYGRRGNGSFYEYNPTQDTWTYAFGSPQGVSLPYSKPFVVNNTLLFVSGSDGWKVNL